MLQKGLIVMSSKFSTPEERKQALGQIRGSCTAVSRRLSDARQRILNNSKELLDFMQKNPLSTEPRFAKEKQKLVDSLSISYQDDQLMRIGLHILEYLQNDSLFENQYESLSSWLKYMEKRSIEPGPVVKSNSSSLVTFALEHIGFFAPEDSIHEIKKIADFEADYLLLGGSRTYLNKTTSTESECNYEVWHKKHGKIGDFVFAITDIDGRPRNEYGFLLSLNGKQVPGLDETPHLWHLKSRLAEYGYSFDEACKDFYLGTIEPESFSFLTHTNDFAVSSDVRVALRTGFLQREFVLSNGRLYLSSNHKGTNMEINTNFGNYRIGKKNDAFDLSGL